tara:strand:- start:20584 stop:21729 length:1146 start_codon:yes stop_codon:yes gene_type:complete
MAPPNKRRGSQNSSRIQKYRTQAKMVQTVRVLVLFFGFIALMTGIFYLCERGAVGEEDSTGWDAVWKILVYFCTGFGDYEPQSPGGKFVAVLVFIVGIGLVATITGRIASYFVRKDQEINMPKDIREHIIICNWNERGDRVVSELHSCDGLPGVEIVVIAPHEINTADHDKKPWFQNVTFINSDPSFHDVLRVCRAHRSRSVILLSDEAHHTDDPDGNSALIALAIHRICQTEGTNTPHIVAEAVDHRRIQHLRDAGVNEVVCAQDFGLGILAQTAIHEGLSEVYNRLLTYSDETNEIYMIEKAPMRFHGMSFQELSLIFAQNRDQQNPAILIGVKRGGDIFLNPCTDGSRGKSLGTIRGGDQLIVVSWEPPDVSKIRIDS